MIWVVVRVGLLLAVALTLTLRVRSIELREDTATAFDIRRSIEGWVRDQGFDLIENPVKPPLVLSAAVYFQRSQCPAKSVIVPFRLNYEASTLLDRVLPDAAYARMFAYLDKTWPAQNRFLMFTEWLRHTFLNYAGASDLVPVKMAIVLAEPASCLGNRTFDWRYVWDRNRYRALTQQSSRIQRQPE